VAAFTPIDLVGCGEDDTLGLQPGLAAPDAAAPGSDNAELVAANEALKADDPTDSDGLADALEEQLGASPFTAGTDFDGYADGREFLELGFHLGSGGNPVRFNPRIADASR